MRADFLYRKEPMKKKTKHTVMAWNSRRILIDVIDSTLDEAEQAARGLQRELRCKWDDERWQVWEGGARIEARGHAIVGIDIAQLPGFGKRKGKRGGA